MCMLLLQTATDSLIFLGQNLKWDGEWEQVSLEGVEQGDWETSPQTVGQQGRLGDWVQYGNWLFLFNMTPSVIGNMKQNKTSVTFCQFVPDFVTETHWSDIHKL